MIENKSDLHCPSLEAPLIIKNYVKGDIDCNYEKYLLEMINHSVWFHQHFKAPFIPPDNENNGQCDAYSADYGLDFKLIASKTHLQAISTRSEQIVIMTKGLYAHCASKNTGPMTYTRLAQAIRGLSIEELMMIQNKKTRVQGLENDISEYLDTLNTNKNLLLLFPFRFRFETPGNSKNDILTIVKLLNNNFSESLQYRSKQYESLDTFFSFFYDYTFVLCKWDKDHLLFIESIPVEKSKTFMHLASTYCHNWDKKYDFFLQRLKEKKYNNETDKRLSD